MRVLAFVSWSANDESTHPPRRRSVGAVPNDSSLGERSSALEQAVGGEVSERVDKVVQKVYAQRTSPRGVCVG